MQSRQFARLAMVIDLQPQQCQEVIFDPDDHFDQAMDLVQTIHEGCHGRRQKSDRRVAQQWLRRGFSEYRASVLACGMTGVIETL